MPAERGTVRIVVRKKRDVLQTLYATEVRTANFKYASDEIMKMYCLAAAASCDAARARGCPKAASRVCRLLHASV
jgi:hypothetical protein